MKALLGRLASTACTKSIRLALSYLAIIMVLSTGFSVIFYRTSTANLDIQLQATTGRVSVGAKNSQPPKRPPYGGYVGTIVEQGQASGANRTLLALNRQLRRRVDAIRADLVRRLIILNIGALVVGAVFSYALARRTLKPIEAAMEAQARFALDASHELRTPLTVMQAETEGALRTLEMSERVRAVLTSNLEEIAQLETLSEGLLRLARENDAVELQPIWIDEVAALAEKHIAKLARGKHVTVSHKPPHVLAMADRQGLLVVLGILLENAIRYGSDGATVYVEGHADSMHAYLSVRDEGPGIGSDDLPHIFDRFYRAKQSRRQHPAGHGLGLSIAQKIIARQHGAITAASTIDKGSTFTVKLGLAGAK